MDPWPRGTPRGTPILRKKKIEIKPEPKPEIQPEVEPEVEPEIVPEVIKESEIIDDGLPDDFIREIKISGRCEDHWKTGNLMGVYKVINAPPKIVTHNIWVT